MTTPALAFAGQLPPQDFTKATVSTLVAGRPASLWTAVGKPGAGTFSTDGINGSVLNAPYSGSLDFTNPVTGNSNLSALTAGSGAQAGQLLLVDRMWQNSGLLATITTEQIITAAPIPVRDRNGTNTGDDVQVALEITTAMAATATVATLKYVNTAGQTKTSTNSIAIASASVGSFIPFNLATGDKGIQKVLSLTLSVATTGAFSIVIYRVISRLSLLAAGVPNAIDMYSGGFPRIYDNSVLQFLFIPQTTTATTITGNLIIAQG